MFEALRIGLKSVVRRPVLAVAIVVPLALATSVSTALFSIPDGLTTNQSSFRSFTSRVSP